MPSRKGGFSLRLFFFAGPPRRIFFFTQRRRVAKPQRGLDLCASPSLRDVIFFVHAKAPSLPGGRQEAKPQRGLDLCVSPSLRDILFLSCKGAVPVPVPLHFGSAAADFFVHAKAQSSKAAKGFLSSLAAPLLCESAAADFSSRKGVFFLRVLINHSLCEQFRF